MSIHSEYELEMTMGDASEQAYLDRLDGMAPLLGKLGAVYQSAPEQMQTTSGLTADERLHCLMVAEYLSAQARRYTLPFLKSAFGTAARELRRLGNQ